MLYALIVGKAKTFIVHPITGKLQQWSPSLVLSTYEYRYQILLIRHKSPTNQSYERGTWDLKVFHAKNVLNQGLHVEALFRCLLTYQSLTPKIRLEVSVHL